jgi:pantoate--beta-alanine ligase
MRIVRSPHAMQRLALAAQREGRPIGFVPTMGYLHDGHISLAREARRRVGPEGLVVVSIYVNPTQFAPTEDLSKYPRDFRRDSALCREAGVDIIFAPGDAAMYPGTDAGRHSTYVIEERLSQRMEGVSRPTHFRGVATVVAKLFNCVLPTVTVFGAKDWQQAAVVRRMIRDLNFPVKLVVAPTRREPDGLAMSSRNKYLNADERLQARVLSQCLKTARERVRASKQGLSAARLHEQLTTLIEAQPAARLDYVAFFHPETLEPVTTVRAGDHMALAVFLGRTRLIDNGRI